MSTVSRVLNGNTAVHPDLRARVEAAINQLRFRPNRIAQTLYHRRSNTLGCILPDIVNPYFAQLFLQLEVGAFERGYTMILGNTTSTPAHERTYLRTLAERQVDGLLYLGGLANDPHPPPEDLQLLHDIAERLPIVTVNGDLPGVPITASVRSDEAGGMRDLLTHLQQLGHTDIAFLGGHPQVTTTLDKLRVYTTTFPHHPPEWVQLTGLTVDAGVRAFEQLRRSNRHPTAVVCINDLTAAGVLDAARRHGLHLPDELSVVGFDDIFLAQLVTPPLTTVNHNYTTLARHALDALHHAITGTPTAHTLHVPTFLVERASAVTLTPRGTPTT